MTEEDIFELVDIHMGGVFRWGESDCFLGVSDVFLALTDLDLARLVRGTYNSEEGASRILASYGGSLAVYLKVQAGRLGLQSLDPDTAPLGSVGVSYRETAFGLDGRCACIKVRPHLWATKAIRGFTLSARAEECWNV